MLANQRAVFAARLGPAPLSAARPLVMRRQVATSAAARDGRQAGTVKWFNATKGYGFITPDDGGADIFVHQTSILSEGFRSLAEGENVEFEVNHDNTGRAQARDVTGPNGAQTVGSTRPRPQSDRQGGGGGYRQRRDYDDY